MNKSLVSVNLYFKLQETEQRVQEIDEEENKEKHFQMDSSISKAILSTIEQKDFREIDSVIVKFLIEDLESIIEDKGLEVQKLFYHLAK